MAKEICISSTPHETRLAILEDDQLAEIYYERENEYTLAGSIYNGRVTRVLPGMQSAFVDLGLERDAFLYVTDFLEMEESEDSDELEKAAASGSSQPPREVRAANVQEQQPAQSSRTDGRAGGRTDGRQEGRQDDRGSRSGQRQDGRTGQDRTGQERQPREQRLSIEAVPESPAPGFAAPEAAIASGEAEGTEGESGTGARRWRGRRRRRGGRGANEAQSPRTESEESAEVNVEAASEGEAVPEIQAAGFAAPTPTPRGPQTQPSLQAQPLVQAPVPFVLPGESLSKYGAAPGVDTPKAAATPGSATVARPASTYKPSTLIEAPLAWDGSGLLAGESISKHRRRETAPDPITQEASGTSFSDAGSDAIEEEEFVEAMTEIEPGSASSEVATTVTEAAPEPVVLEAEDDGPVEEQLAEEGFEEDLFEETSETAPETVPEAEFETAPETEPESAPGTSPAEPAAGIANAAEGDHPTVGAMAEEMSGDDPVASAVLRQDETPHGFGRDAAESPDGEENEGPVAAAQEAKGDASASHHVDAAPPTGFRLFGLGGKKKTEETAAASVAGVVSRVAEPKPEPAPVVVKTISSYAPGSGLIEEETIEEEELDAPHHHHGKTDEHDLDDFEEETLQSQMRTGDLGELLQEAHLDHRIQLNFDEKNGEDEIEEGFDEEVDEEEPPAEAQPAGGDGGGQARRGDRRDRGRRGRGGTGGSGDRGGQGGQRPGDRRGGSTRRSAQTSDLPIISDLLKPGQEILVQIAKEPIAKKGARITSHIALPGRFLVFMPTVSHIGVSRKIASDEERQRLKRILIHERGEASGGFIVRTAGEGASEDELRSDLRMLIHVWNEIKQRSDSSKSPALIYHDLGLIERILRDQISADFNSIWVDSEENYERIVRFLNRVSPSLVRRVKLYTKEVPLFEHFGIQDEIAKALRSKVWLKSGGSIVINQTEALVAIDINTGKYVGKSARLEDTIVKTNLDAVPEIVRQIRLRDLGGIIVIDFIDMDERKNRFKVLAALEEALKADRAPTKVLQFNDFGLVAITRKRVKQSLERTLSVPCPTCQATGMVKSPTTVCNEIYTELRKMKKHFEGADVLLRVNPETVKVLKANNASWLTEFEELVGKNILVKSDATLHPEQFDIQG